MKPSDATDTVRTCLSFGVIVIPCFDLRPVYVAIEFARDADSYHGAW